MVITGETKLSEWKKFHRRVTAVWWTVLSAGLFALMLFVSQNKTLVIRNLDMSDEGSALPPEASAASETGAETAGRVWSRNLTVEREDAQTGKIVIPIPEKVKAEDIHIVNDYLFMECSVYIKGADSAFYAEHTVLADEAVLAAGYEKQNGRTVLHFAVQDIYEYKSSLEDGSLTVGLLSPREVYDTVVMLDAKTPDGVEAQVCNLVKEKNTDNTLGIYVTCQDSVAPDSAGKKKMLEKLAPDLMLYVEADALENPEEYGNYGWYNACYVIPGFGNVEFADLVTRNVTIACSNRATGLFEAKEGSILYDARNISAGVHLGNAANEKERGLMRQSRYQNLLAEGILNALNEAKAQFKTR